MIFYQVSKNIKLYQKTDQYMHPTMSLQFMLPQKVLSKFHLLHLNIVHYSKSSRGGISIPTAVTNIQNKCLPLQCAKIK